MADIPGNETSSTTITVGTSISGQLEFTGDHDWYRLELTAGEAVSVLMAAAMPLDAYLTIRDSAGNVIRDDVPVSDNTNSRITFTAPYTGTYYVDAGAFMDLATGTYQLSVSSFTLLPVASIDEFAAFLTDGGGGNIGPLAFDAGEGDTITVNIANLDAGGQYLAQQALGLWSDLTGIQFVTVSVGGQIQFDDENAGAYGLIQVSDGFITSGFVNIAKASIAIDGPNLGTFAFQSYLHEIGHVLGLNHAGPYNGSSIDYVTDAIFANDGWPFTIMSYFDQEASVYFADQGFSRAFYGTPMMADIAAMGQLYGLSTTTRSGDTTYGFNSTAGRAVFDATQHPAIAYTIFDSGGIDTLDFSGFLQDQRIDLAQGAYSNVGGLVGTVAIAFGTVIEHAIGGAGDDVLLGNSANNHLIGGGGNDVLIGGRAATFSPAAPAPTASQVWQPSYRATRLSTSLSARRSSSPTPILRPSHIRCRGRS